jgi:hypothetical protein
MADRILARNTDPLADADVAPASWVTAVGGRVGRSLEDRAGVESLERLHHQRRVVMEQLAPLKAMHGSFGKWDARRKQLLGAIAVRVRSELQARGEKISEGLVDSMTHADPQYERVVDEGIESAARYFRLQTELDEIEERIRSREIALSAYNAELRLQR